MFTLGFRKFYGFRGFKNGDAHAFSTIDSFFWNYEEGISSVEPALPGMHIFIWGHEWGHTVKFTFWPIGGESVAVTSLLKEVTS